MMCVASTGGEGECDLQVEEATVLEVMRVVEASEALPHVART